MRHLKKGDFQTLCFMCVLMVAVILEWVYTNPALVMNESVPHHPSVMTRQQPSSSSVQEIYSMPRTFAAMRSISRDESETSESRKIGSYITFTFNDCLLLSSKKFKI